MAKKSSRAPTPPPPPPPPAQQDPDELLAPINELVQSLVANQATNSAQMMELFNAQFSMMLNEQTSNPTLDVDWAAEREAIRERLRLNSTEDEVGNEGPQGRGSTINTSPLLDDEDPSVIEPVAIGDLDEDS